ncbi:N-alpha-acetyltransferase 16, NatA auxiliary subunit-like [Sycon ciliatum]|uniref:N-alpha-acetyltransferase 16, NatA auxiliary subunit-like n=1 Tax=Sycon ciliatum TaxID=27933 RepID=UPI0020AE3230|eukprot:scpid28064/ scgid18443/ N-alpha-acetyltransferase 16, NatA auxiliary subunit; NMDA receptor-regulated 1-like protein
MSSSSQTLPPKEATLFKRILRCYEMKQFKAGLKYAKQILSNSKYAEHGETLAMKGLTLSCLGRKDEAYEDARRGLKNDLKSHVCWHVYGLLQRSDRKYDEAIKCYRNALKLDTDNVQILRDLALLQIQMRDLEGYRETKSRLLQLKPGHKPSWLGFGVAHHLLNEQDLAIQIVREYHRTQANLNGYETSELVLYENQLMQKSKPPKQAIDHLRRTQSSVRDWLSHDETMADLLFSEGRLSEAAEVVAGLIDRNPERWSYYNQLENCLSLETEEERVAIYDTVLQDHPRAMAPKRLPLNFTTGDRFRCRVETFIRSGLRKGIPQLFNSLRSLYSCQEKVDVIQDLCLGFAECLKKDGKCKPDDAEEEPPCTYLWLLFFLAQHYDKLGNNQLALQYITDAIEHTPTLIELYMVKAKIYKHAGDLKCAALLMDEAREMDTADRYVNCKAAKYMLRINNVERAEELCAMFTREGLSSAESLTEMQCMWYLTESARAYMRRGEWGEALKKCHEIDRHFEEFVEDQFDFHTYCLRRGTLRTYTRMLAVEDTIHQHKFFGNGAKTAIECYLHLFDHPVQDEAQKKEEEFAGMDSKERKKELSKQRKAAKKRAQQQQEAEQKKEKAQAQKVDKEDREEKQLLKEKLDPKQLAKADNPLEQAIKFLKPLQTFRSEDPTTHFLAFRVYAKKGKVLPMLKALKQASRLVPEHAQYHACLCEFALTVKRRSSELPAAVLEVANQGLKELTAHRDVEELNSEFLKAHSNSLEHRLAGGRVIYQADASRQAAALEVATNLDDSLVDRTLCVCSAVYKALEGGEFGECVADVAKFKSRCHDLFPLAVIFFSDAELEKLADDLKKLGMTGSKPVVNGHAENGTAEA